MLILTLEEIEELLDPKIFYRANRQAIVHIDSIQSVKPHENQKLHVDFKSSIEDGAGYQPGKSARV